MTGRQLTAEDRLRELLNADKIICAYGEARPISEDVDITEDVRDIVAENARLRAEVEHLLKYKQKWESCCERERARWETEKEQTATLAAVAWAMHDAMNNLGVPQPGYPTPTAEAYRTLNAAVRAIRTSAPVEAVREMVEVLGRTRGWIGTHRMDREGLGKRIADDLDAALARWRQVTGGQP